MNTNSGSQTWFPADKTLPIDKKEVSVRGSDTSGKWKISGGVWWKPYKGQPHQKGRWVCKDAFGKFMKLPESDDVDEWNYI